MLQHNQVIEFTRPLPGSFAVTGAKYRVDLEWTEALVRLTDTATGRKIYEEPRDLAVGLKRGAITVH